MDWDLSFKYTPKRNEDLYGQLKTRGMKFFKNPFILKKL
jgi:hypothetical protein